MLLPFFVVGKYKEFSTTRMDPVMCGGKKYRNALML